MRKTILLFFLLFRLFDKGKAEIPSTYAEQVLFLRPYYGQPAKINQLKDEALRTGNFSFLKVIKLVENSYNSSFYSSKRNTVEKDLLDLIATAKGTENSGLAAHAMYLLSQYYWLMNMPDKALEFGLKAYDLYLPLNEKQFPPKMTALYELASKFYYYHDFLTARQYFLQAANVTDHFKEIGKVTLLNTIGLCYRNLQRYDSAEFYFKKALPLIDGPKDIWNGILKGNLGITYYYKREFDAAIPLLKTDIETSYNGEPENAANSLSILGDIYFKTGDLNNAFAHLNEANRLLESRCMGNAKLIIAIYPRLASLYETRGNYLTANRLMKIARLTEDSLAAKTNALILAGVQLKVEAEKHSTERKMLEQQRDMQNYIRNTLIIGLILLAALAILFINRQKLKHVYKVRQKEIELNEASRQLKLFTEALHQKNTMLDQYNRQLEELKQEKRVLNEESENVEAISQLQQLTLITEAEWENFRVLFEKVHEGFLVRLRYKLPELSPAEIRFMALTKLNFSNREIANSLGVGAGAVRTTKSRLRKKLGLVDDESIEDFIQNI